MPKNGLFF